MVRVEKINLDSRSWWTPKESIGPDAGEFRPGQYPCHMWTEAVVGSQHRLVKVFMIRRGKVKLSPAVLSRLEAAFRKTVAELHESKPEPSAEPPVWAEVKAALADAVPYFRKHQGSLYTKDRIAQGMLVDAEYGTSTYTPTECIELVPESHRLPVVDYIAYFLGSLIDFRPVIDTHFNRWALLGRTVTVNMATQPLLYPSIPCQAIDKPSKFWALKTIKLEFDGVQLTADDASLAQIDFRAEIGIQTAMFSSASILSASSTSTMPYVQAIEKIGTNLRNFSIIIASDVDDRLIDALSHHSIYTIRL
ncbi:hypothetical protein K449DRAFT_439271 [Hypoxylon sp. EC38]|nr:hypothetical protein K449DRAFT_439271 [Hypoxylon sp. EC38]